MQSTPYTVLVSFAGTLNLETLSTENRVAAETNSTVYLLNKVYTELNRAIAHGYISSNSIDIKAVSLEKQNFLIKANEESTDKQISCTDQSSQSLLNKELLLYYKPTHSQGEPMISLLSNSESPSTA